MRKSIFTFTILLLFSLILSSSNAYADIINLTEAGNGFDFECAEVGDTTFLSPDPSNPNADNISTYIPQICVGLYEVDQGTWQKIMKTNPAHFRSDPKNPIENITYNDALKFIEKLNTLTGLKFRLLTYAEWLYLVYDDIFTDKILDQPDYAICEQFNLYDNTSRKINSFGNKEYRCDDTFAYTAPVDSFKPNRFGIYNLIGNVAEWGVDTSGKNIKKYADYSYYSSLKNIAKRVALGGAFTDGVNDKKIQFVTHDINAKFGGLGLRLVLEQNHQTSK